MALGTRMMMALLLALGAGATRADEAGAILDRYRAITGGERWDAVSSLAVQGALKAGGLEGTIEGVEDLRSGRAMSRYDLKVVKGAQGFDGEHAWSQDPGGEVAVLDAEEAVKSARTDAWMTRRGYWHRDGATASFGKPETRKLDGKTFDVIVATPEGGREITLWFDHATGLLTRSETMSGQDAVISTFDDWREVDGLRLPFAQITDQGGDARNRTEVRYTKVTTNVAITDATFAAPSMGDHVRIANDIGETTVPFRLVNNHLLSTVTIDGQPATVIVDTGGANVLTPAAARRLGLSSEGEMAGRGVGEQRVKVSFARARELKFGELIYSQPNFYVMDLGTLSAQEGETIDGIVGYELFQRFGVTLDYARGEVRLSEPARFKPPAGATEIPMRLTDRIPLIEGMLDGTPMTISVDTGSRSTFTAYGPFTRDHELVTRYRAAPEAIAGWGVGGGSLGRAVRVGELRLGDQVLRQVAAELFTGDKGAFAAPDVGVNLGSGALRRFTVAFNYQAKRMYLAPNASFDAPFDYDRSGLWLSLDGEALKVEAVAPDSAAMTAKLVAGDRVRRIDGAAVGTRSLMEWREFLAKSTEGTRVKLDFERNGHAMSAVLTLRNRIPDRSVVTP